MRASWLVVMVAVAACRTAREVPPGALAKALAECPAALDDEMLRDGRPWLGCQLPAHLVALIRNEYVEDEVSVPPWEALQPLASQVSAADFERQLWRVVNPDRSLEPWLALNVPAGELRPDVVGHPEARITFGERGPPPCWPRRPLRVVLDPGHLGGEWSRFEGRHLALADVVVREGDLTLRTARELEPMLVAKGFEVRLTRHDAAPQGQRTPERQRHALEATRRALENDPAYLAVEGTLGRDDKRRLDTAFALQVLRKLATFDDLRARVLAFRDLPPDAMVSIHYNAGPWATGSAHPEAPTLALVGGMVQRTRVYLPAWRWRAYADAMAIDRFEASRTLAFALAREVSRALGMPLATPAQANEDQQPLPWPDGSPSGVSAWNGVVMRYADWPLVLTEGPFMNEATELPRLASDMASPLGTPGTRMFQYASGLSAGLEAWAKTLPRCDEAR